MTLRLFFVGVLLLVGCKATSLTGGMPQKLTNELKCEFSDIDGLELSLSDFAKKYRLETFLYNLDSSPKLQVSDYNKKYYDKLSSGTVKIVDTGLAATHPEIINATQKKSVELALNQKPYVYQTGTYTKLIDNDCNVFYFMSDENAYQNFRHNDKWLDDNLKIQLFGKSLEAATINAYSNFDEFEHVLKVSTYEFDNRYIRGEMKNGRLLSVRLHFDLYFKDKWGMISSAFSEDGLRLPVTKIDTNVNCNTAPNYSRVRTYNPGTSCILRESVAVDVSLDMLRSANKGVRFKLKGQQERIEYMSQEMIIAFLSEYERRTRKN